MPAGLDGNANPFVTTHRSAVINEIVRQIVSCKEATGPILIAVDGIDGAGKSTFADELALAMPPTNAGRALNPVRSTIDSFHNPRVVRWKRGRSSPLGFYLDSHDLQAVQRELLEPFDRGVGAPYRVGNFDVLSDQPLSAPTATVAAGDILLFDGIFVQRPELAHFWNLTIFLDAQQRVDLDRLGYLLDGCPDDATNAVAHTLNRGSELDRYVSGMRYYLDLVDPISTADIVIDNNDLKRPAIVRT
jgi:uridine kinase